MLFTKDPTEITKAIEDGHNVFITGSAGSGKTYLASKFAKSTGKIAVLTATTGIAALNLGGETIHRFLSLGIASRQFEADKIISRWFRFSKSKYPAEVQKWKLIQSLEVLVIDEVSMLRSDQFELIDTILSAIREDNRPFGGIQMVLVGDFFQLPPVVSGYDLKRFPDLDRPFAFQSDVWGHANFKEFNLGTNYRQAEGNFLDALEQIRVGKLTPEVEDILKSRIDVDLNTSLEPIRIFPHRKAATAENMRRLKTLTSDKMISDAEYTGNAKHVESLKKESPVDDNLYFCIGAQIMMLTNDVGGTWVNGSMGVISKIDKSGIPTIELANGCTTTVEYHTWERKSNIMKDGKLESKTLATMSQYPFRLAYATSIHKSQGLTMDYIHIDLANCFVPGQAYTALSRVKTLAGLNLQRFNPESIFANEDVLKFYGI